MTRHALQHVALGATIIAYAAALWINRHPQPWQWRPAKQKRIQQVILSAITWGWFAWVVGAFGRLSDQTLLNSTGVSIFAAVATLIWVLVHYTGKEPST